MMTKDRAVATTSYYSDDNRQEMRKMWLSQTHVEVADVASRWHPGKRIPAPH